MSSAPNWLLYGANGYTGRLVIEEALRRGQRPILSGRSEGPLRTLGTEHGLETRVVSLDDGAGLLAALDGVAAVLHCAGPFSRTAKPMVRACLEAGVHYLDITGEIAVFESIYRRHEEAKDAGVVLMPGVGFDVVPTDAVAALLADAMPSATHLALAFAGEGGVSRGTSLTALEGFPLGGAERRDGELVPLPTGEGWRKVSFADRSRWVVQIPWGDLSSAWRTTGIPNIQTSMAASRRAMKVMALVRPAMGLWPMRTLAAAAIRGLLDGPSPTARSQGYCQVWGEVRDDAGQRASMTLTGPEAYTLTAQAAVEATRRVAGGAVDSGAWTPSSGLGADFVGQLEGVSLGDIERGESGL